MQEDYLAKWLANELTEAEVLEFEKSEAYATYKKIKDATGRLQTPIFDTDTAWNALQAKRESGTSKLHTLSPFKGFLKVAAVIAIILTGAYFYLGFKAKTIVTQFAERTELVLPDASEVVLNAASELSYSPRNWAKQRTINLKGEAFFKVAKGKSFTVHSGEGTVTVLGTQFNVTQRQGIFEVSCYEGLVSVRYKDRQYQLPAGKGLQIINGKLTETTTRKNGEPSWVLNESSFKSIPLKFVLAEFQRQHNISVDSKGIDTNILFTGSFSNTDTKLALQSISIPLQIKFTLEGNNVLFYEENAPE